MLYEISNEGYRVGPVRVNFYHLAGTQLSVLGLASFNVRPLTMCSLLLRHPASPSLLEQGRCSTSTSLASWCGRAK